MRVKSRGVGMGGGGLEGLEPPKIAKLPINEAQIASLFEHPFNSAPLPVSSSHAIEKVMAQGLRNLEGLPASTADTLTPK